MMWTTNNADETSKATNEAINAINIGADTTVPYDIKTIHMDSFMWSFSVDKQFGVTQWGVFYSSVRFIIRKWRIISASQQMTPNLFSAINYLTFMHHNLISLSHIVERAPKKHISPQLSGPYFITLCSHRWFHDLRQDLRQTLVGCLDSKSKHLILKNGFSFKGKNGNDFVISKKGLNSSRLWISSDFSFHALRKWKRHPWIVTWGKMSLAALCIASSKSKHNGNKWVNFFIQKLSKTEWDKFVKFWRRVDTTRGWPILITYDINERLTRGIRLIFRLIFRKIEKCFIVPNRYYRSMIGNETI